VSLWTRNIVVFNSREFAFCAAIYRDKTRDWFHLPRASSEREISLESRGVPASRAESRLIPRRGQKSRKEGFALGAYAGRQLLQGDPDNTRSHKARFSCYRTAASYFGLLDRARARARGEIQNRWRGTARFGFSRFCRKGIRSCDI